MSGPTANHRIATTLTAAIALLILSSRAGLGQQQSCQINGSTMVCPNGVTVGGVGQSVFFGNKALTEGTGEFTTPDGREIHDFGNKGITLGGQGQAERRVEPR